MIKTIRSRRWTTRSRRRKCSTTISKSPDANVSGLFVLFVPDLSALLSGFEQYHKLKRNPLYVDVHYDAQTGGLQATHVEHRFDPKRGYYEKYIQELLFAHGHKVILESEVLQLQNVKTPDGSLNDRIFEIKAIEGTGHNNIKRKFNEAHSQGCEHVVLYYPNLSLYNEIALHIGYGKYQGVLRQHKLSDTLSHIWLVVDGEIIVYK